MLIRTLKSKYIKYNWSIKLCSNFFYSLGAVALNNFYRIYSCFNSKSKRYIVEIILSFTASSFS